MRMVAGYKQTYKVLCM